MKRILTLLLGLLLVYSCSSDDTPKIPIIETSTTLVPPTLTTTAPSSVTTTTASSGGTISSDGGASITARGVVWSTNTNPTIALSTKTEDGSSTGTFTSDISGLMDNTTYYVRAYATNSKGTSYGNQVSFITANNLGSSSEVTIGTQTWATKNLDVSTYSDGTVIPQVTDPTAWARLKTGAWCYYNNDSAIGITYGKLYNWYAVAGIHDTDPNTPNKSLAPTGWHVPTDAEWTTLITFLGGEDIAGGKMKTTGTTYWKSPNTNATNSSGFTGFGGGYRNTTGGTFSSHSETGYWWTSTERNDITNVAVGYYLKNWIDNANRGSGSMTNGFSVRCLRD